MALRIISQLHNLKGEKVLVRIDSDVDLNDHKIIDDTRLKSSLETIRYIIDQGGSVTILGHLGRPDGKVVKEFSLKPIAKWFEKEFNGKLEEIDEYGFSGWKITDHLSLLENLRFYKEEEEGNQAFAGSLALFGESYVNEAFAVSHRNHASIVGISSLLPSYAGLHLAKEVEALSKILKDPDRPLVVVIGGAKIETKLPVVKMMHKIADYVLVGGKIAEETKALIKIQHEKIAGHKSVVLVADNTPDGLDITEKDSENFMQIFGLANTIVWNGPVGKMGEAQTEENSLKIARSIADSKAYTVVGGGDTLALLSKHNLLDRFDFVSTGGGAMLEFLSGKNLPGIEALRI